MHSIPAALTWELLRRGRWPIAGAIVGSLAFPLMIFAALERDGALDPTAPGIIMMQLIITQVALLGLGAGIFAALGPPSRMFTMPVSTPGIVLAHLIPAGILAAGLWSACVAVLNGFLPLDWPVLGPALFAAVVVPLVLATSWYADKSVWLPVFLAVAAAVPFLWLKTRYGGALSDPDHQWQNVTPGEGLILACLGVVGYFVGVAGVTRQRRHEPLAAPKLLEWLARVLERTPAENLRFRSAEEAQLWVEWNSKGIMLPGMLFFVGAFAFLGWLLFSRSVPALSQGILGGGVMLPLTGGLVGLLIGNFGPTDSNSAMGPWVASRPLPSTAIANVVLKNQFRAVAICTVSWQLALWASTAVAGSSLPQQGFPPAEIAAANWLLPWAAASVGTLVCLTGRSGWIGIGFTVAAFVAATTGLIIRWLSGGDAARIYSSGLLIVLSIATISGTIVSFVAAVRRGMISPRVVAGCGLALALLLPIVAWQWREQFVLTLVASAIVTWCVAPFAMAPLAVAWNRSR